MKIVMNPAFLPLTDFINGIPQHRYAVDKVFCNHRNTVELTRYQGVDLVVKRFKRPTLANCFVYTFLRKSKCRRAYENAFRLREKGVATAPPVAYMEKKKYGLFHTGWYISGYLPYPTLDEEYHRQDATGRDGLAWAAMDYLMSLFQKGIVNRDNNSSNILAFRENGNWQFALVDINRITWRRPGFLGKIRALAQLRACPSDLVRYMPFFADRNHVALDKCFLILLLEKRRRERIHQIKCRLKSILRSLGVIENKNPHESKLISL